MCSGLNMSHGSHDEIRISSTRSSARSKRKTGSHDGILAEFFQGPKLVWVSSLVTAELLGRGCVVPGLIWTRQSGNAPPRVPAGHPEEFFQALRTVPSLFGHKMVRPV